MTLSRRRRALAVRRLGRTWSTSRRALKVAAPRVVLAIWLVTALNPAISALVSQGALDSVPVVPVQRAELTGEEQWLGPGHLDGDDKDCERSVDCLLSTLKGKSGELSLALDLGRGGVQFLSPPPSPPSNSALVPATTGPHLARAPPSYL